MFAARKTDGAATAAAANYIEDVFSTYLYTGNGSVQTINNSIALGSAYGGSVYLDGSGDYLTAASNAAFNFGTGDFTIEFWFYPTNVTTTQIIYDQRFSGSNQVAPAIYLASSIVRYYVSGADRITSGSSFSNNQWYHIAVSRSGTSTRMFVNGTQVGSTYTDNNNYITSPVRVGAFGVDGTLAAAGYFSNVRLVKGTAIYTSSFTPSTTPLTAVTNTQLLICQSPSPTTDYSSNAFAITVTNAVAQNGGGPFTDSTANKGGMVWLKSRSAATDHALYDTNRGATFDLASNLSTAQTTQTTGLTSFNSNGFSIRSLAKLNTNAATYTSWTFRKQAKFFDVVTYAGNGSTTRTISHNLGSVPGFIIIKETSAAEDWCVLAGDSSGNYQYLYFNTGASSGSVAKSSVATSTTIDIAPIRANYGTNAVNESSQNYVMYLFAHNAGGFGATGSDNVISCGSYTGNGGANTVTLGYEPQWLLVKKISVTDSTSFWSINDNMRGGLNALGNASQIKPNGPDAEDNLGGVTTLPAATATGFTIGNAGGYNASGETYIYIAIRRGPMKTPTSGTSVFSPQTATGVQSPNIVTDATLFGVRAGAAYSPALYDRLRGGTIYSITSSTAAEAVSATIGFDTNNGVTYSIPADWVTYYFRRAPGFFDVVCDTGTASAHTITHGLTVVPELMIRKKRNSATNSDWVVWHTAFTGTTKYLYLNSTAAEDNNSAFWTSTAPTSTVFSVGTGSRVNNTGDTYVTYLFASVNGVSKVGSYTGNGSSQTINCGFAAGARFILIKRTSSTGDWYVWDTARGIVAGNDPRLSLNTTAAEVTTDDSIDPDNSGFIVNQVAATNINVNAATYIYLAIA